LCLLQFCCSTKGSTYASVQAQCQAAVREGSNHPVTLKISQCAKNTSRGITRWASKFVIHLNLVLVNTEVFTLILHFSFFSHSAPQGPRVDSLLVPLRGKHGVILRSISIVKPSSWFAFLSKRPGWFAALLLGATSEKDRVQFWACARQIPDLSFLTPPEEVASQYVPFKLHGDKGPYYKKRNLQVFSISSLFAHSADSTLSRLALCSFAALSVLIVMLLQRTNKSLRLLN
jgi:hypothetical protein